MEGQNCVVQTQHDNSRWLMTKTTPGNWKSRGCYSPLPRQHFLQCQSIWFKEVSQIQELRAAKMPFCFLLVRHQRSDCTLVALANGDNAAALFAPGKGIGTNMLCSAISNIRQHEHVRCWRFWFCVPFNSATKMLSKHMYCSSVYRVNPIQSYAVYQFYQLTTNKDTQLVLTKLLDTLLYLISEGDGGQASSQSFYDLTGVLKIDFANQKTGECSECAAHRHVENIEPSCRSRVSIAPPNSEALRYQDHTQSHDCHSREFYGRKYLQPSTVFLDSTADKWPPITW